MIYNHPLLQLEYYLAYEKESYAHTEWKNSIKYVSEAYDRLSLHNAEVRYPMEGNYYAAMLSVLEEHLAYAITIREKALLAYLRRKKDTESAAQEFKRMGGIL